MGSNNSKSTNETSALVQKNDTEKDVGGNLDPRSPTPEITRTPLQSKNGVKHNITKNVDLRKTFENGKTDGKLIHNNPILSAVIKNHLQSFDPRSPTQDFERTPIILPLNVDEIERRQNLHDLVEGQCGSPCLRDETLDNSINNKSLNMHEVPQESILPKNLCNEFYDMTINDSLKESDEPLGSSTASNEAIEENIPKGSLALKPTTLLETNFEYIDDDVQVLIKKETNDEHAFEDKQPDYLNHIPLYEIITKDPRSPSLNIDRTPIIVSKVEGDNNYDIIKDISDESLIKVLQNTNTELRQNLDKKDGILIYEDESVSVSDTPKKQKSVNNGGSRTPLSCMKNKGDATHARSKSATNKDLKTIAKKVSHIPRLKSLNRQSTLFQTGSTISLKNIGKTSVVGGDCENTPPQTHRDKWDQDSSIVL